MVNLLTQDQAPNSVHVLVKTVSIHLSIIRADVGQDLTSRMLIVFLRVLHPTLQTVYHSCSLDAMVLTKFVPPLVTANNSTTVKMNVMERMVSVTSSSVSALVKTHQPLMSCVTKNVDLVHPCKDSQLVQPPRCLSPRQMDLFKT